MENYLKYLSLTLVVVMSLGLSGCMGGDVEAPAYTAISEESDEEDMVTFDASDGIEELKDRIKTMNDERVPFYVPNSMNNVNEKYNYIVDLSKEKDSDEKVYIKAKELNQLIDETYTRKEVISKRFVNILKHYNTLLSLKSNIAFEDRFLDLKDDMQNIINDFDVTGGIFSSAEANLDALSDTEELASRMLALEVDTVLKRDYEPSATRFEIMSDEDFEEYAPITFAAAKVKLVELKNFIKNNHLNQDGIKKVKMRVDFEFSHLSHIVIEVKYLLSASNNEKILLDQESRYDKMMKKLSLGDNRDKSLQDQFKMIPLAIDKIKDAGNDTLLENANKIGALEKELLLVKDEVKVSKEELAKKEAEISDLNMQLVTATMKVENLNKKFLEQDTSMKEKDAAIKLLEENKMLIEQENILVKKEKAAIKKQKVATEKKLIYYKNKQKKAKRAKSKKVVKKTVVKTEKNVENTLKTTKE